MARRRPARAVLLPCWRVSSGNAFMRASARLWQLLVADAVAEPLFGASLAGCKYRWASTKILG